MHLVMQVTDPGEGIKIRKILLLALVIATVFFHMVRAAAVHSDSQLVVNFNQVRTAIGSTISGLASICPVKIQSACITVTDVMRTILGV